MEINEYQNKAIETAIYPKDIGIYYCILGLTGESGEVADKLKKIIRDKKGEITIEDRKEIGMELGDVLWYIANLANDLGFTLDDVAQANINKLSNRVKNNTIHGSGDNR